MRTPENRAVFMPGRGEGVYVPAGRTDIVNDPVEVKTEVAADDAVVSDTGTSNDS
jgi:hypothetical protein